MASYVVSAVAPTTACVGCWPTSGDASATLLRPHWLYIEPIAERIHVSDADVTDCLNELIEHCRYSGDALRRFACHADLMALQLLMSQRATAWRRCEIELRALHIDGPNAPDCHSRREWVDAQTSLSGCSDSALLAECERCEDLALRRYRDALEQDLPRVLRAVAQRHADGILSNRARMRHLRVSAVLAPA